MKKSVDKDLEDQVEKVMNDIKKYCECVENECEGKYVPHSGELYDCEYYICNHHFNASQEFMDF
ncbi:MAG: hypothetical protein ACR5KV_04390 [Wolbachia sp.]